MEEKLYLRNRGDGNYFLESRTNNSASVVGSLNPTHFAEHKLSLQNCQAIENGYDLDELADEYYKQFDNLPVIRYNAYTAGFQKALEILGDKKFSDEDIRIAMDRVWNWCEDDQDEDCSSMTELRNKHLQSLQQNEWSVEIVEEEPLVAKARQIHGEYVASKLIESTVFPKPLFDTDGCLILKRK